MSLRAQAERDLAATLEAPGDFGWPITVIAPDGTVATLSGSSGDIGAGLDIDTGQMVSMRKAKVTLRSSSLVAAGFTSIPQGVHDPKARPWVVEFNDTAGNLLRWKVRHSMPDRELGVLTLLLEYWGS